MNLAHEGHQGIVRTKLELYEMNFNSGLGLTAWLTNRFKSCKVCLSSDKTTNVRVAPLQPVPFPSMPWEIVAVDIVGPFETVTWDCRTL